MAVRRRRPAPKAGPAQTVRVHDISTLDGWRAALAKAEASRRVLVVQLYQVPDVWGKGVEGVLVCCACVTAQPVAYGYCGALHADQQAFKPTNSCLPVRRRTGARHAVSCSADRACRSHTKGCPPLLVCLPPSGPELCLRPDAQLLPPYEHRWAAQGGGVCGGGGGQCRGGLLIVVCLQCIAATREATGRWAAQGSGANRAGGGHWRGALQAGRCGRWVGKRCTVPTSVAPRLCPYENPCLQDALLEELGVLHGATKLPHYECYAGGQMVEVRAVESRTKARGGAGWTCAGQCPPAGWTCTMAHSC